MNEWSPGGNYSCPVTPSQNGKSLRANSVQGTKGSVCQGKNIKFINVTPEYRLVPDESVKGTKPVVSSRLMPECRSRHFVQHSMEDVTKGFSLNKKLAGSGTSDPRFKRVVPFGVQNDACVGTETKSVNSSFIPEKTSQTSGNPECPQNKTWVNFSEISNKAKQDAEILTAPEDPNLNQSHDLKEVDKLTFSNDNYVCNLMHHESGSECTVNTRNMSLVSEEFPQGTQNALEAGVSPTSVKKVENWIQDQGPKLGKKHSVITVIGQMQEPDVLSSALQEIDKRRKLAKELDKFAICKRIIETDKEKEISDLLLKISSLNNTGNYLFCGSDETLNTSNSTKDFDEKLKKTHKPSVEETLNSSEDKITDSIMKKNSFLKNKITKCKSKSNCLVKDMVLNDFSSKKVFCILIAISGILFWFAFFSIHKSTYMPFDLFNTKPKPVTWYEKICKWLWELFRPSKSYHRTSNWHSY